ncbi:MAG: hypothetical protein J1F27_02680, partial [Prevotellaceae bacterium]|nr:hypothetical protein [Prevotellaceae bacterium]
FDESTFSIQLYRIDTKGELTVPLKVECDENIFTVPASATFADGESEVTITITYNSDPLEYDEYHDISVTINDDKLTTPYAYSTYTFSAGVPAPWTDWTYTKSQWVKDGNDPDEWPLSETESTCTYTYKLGVDLTGNDPDLPISYRMNKMDKTKAQFKIEHWYYNVDLVLDYNPQTRAIRIYEQITGLSNGEEDIIVCDFSILVGADLTASYPSTYDPETGRFILNICYTIPSWVGSSRGYGFGEEYIQVDGFFIPDYTTEMTYKGVMTDPTEATYASVDVVLGENVEGAKLVVYTRDADPSAIADALVSGDLAGIDAVAGRNDVPFSLDELGANELQVVLVSIADEEAVAYASANFEYYGGGSNPWKVLGTGYFTDDIVTPYYFFEDPESIGDPITYPVEIRQHEDYPGLYRIMNPWGKDVYRYAEFCEPGELAPDGSYLEVNAQDAEGVYIPTQALNMDWGYGPMAFVSEGARYLEVPDYSFDDMKNAGYLGTLRDGVITFPVFTTKDGLNYQGVLWEGNDGSCTGLNCKIEIVLPGASAYATSLARAKANLTKKAAKRAHVRGTKAEPLKFDKKIVRTTLKQVQLKSL